MYYYPIGNNVAFRQCIHAGHSDTVKADYHTKISINWSILLKLPSWLVQSYLPAAFKSCRFTRPDIADLGTDRCGPHDLSHLAIEVFPVQEPPPSPTVSMMAVPRRRLGRYVTTPSCCCTTMGFLTRKQTFPGRFRLRL